MSKEADATEATTPVLVLRYPDGREISAPLDRLPDGADDGRFIWTTYAALISIAREAVDQPEGALDMPGAISTLVRLEHGQRGLTGAYRGMLEEARRLLEDLGSPMDGRGLKALDAEARVLSQEVSETYRRFKDLMVHPTGRPWKDSKKTVDFCVHHATLPGQRRSMGHEDSHPHRRREHGQQAQPHGRPGAAGAVPQARDPLQEDLHEE